MFSDMADSLERKSKTKHRKSTCAGCRRRKSKCDGRAPKCTTCITYKDECIYDKPPSLAYVRSLEDEIEQLRNQLKSFKTQAWISKTSHIEEKKILPVTSPASSTSASRHSEPGRNGILPFRSPRLIKWETDISVDDRGSISFHGSTSAVHEPPNLQQAARISPAQALSPQSQEEEEQTKFDLRQNAQQQRQLEEFAIANTAPRVNLPKEVSEELLKFHWCWQHPLFIFVYRPAFTRGMTLVNSSQPNAPDPPYYSETLLKVMLSHSARFLNHDIYQQHFNMRFTAAEFVQQTAHDARLSLAMETLNTSSIPTIQALLQQSAREFLFAKPSQAWLYGGMAFRMAFDMGIHLPSDKLQTFVKSLSNEDIEIRKRLFWSCYTWDKVLSLYLGRMPAFVPLTDEIPLTFLDDYTDTDPWQPYYGETPEAQSKVLPPYPPTPGHIVSCFLQLSKLCIIVNDLMQSIYSGEATAKRDDDLGLAESKVTGEEPFLRISRSLQEWWSALPLHLKVNPDQTPNLAPPIHIMSLNLLYHTIVILLNRPVVLVESTMQAQSSTRSYVACVAATGAIHDLLVLQANTFGLSQISYLNAYCAYMAATIAVLRYERELKPTEDYTITSRRIGLEYLLDVISRSAKTMPSLQRSDAIMKKRMKGVIDAHLQAHHALSPNTIAQHSASIAPSTNQIALAQATAFQQISNPGIGHVNQPVPYAINPVTNSTTPVMTDSSSPQFPLIETPALNGQMPLPAFVDDFLPAFPGQQFPVGSEYNLGGSDFDTQARTALMGYNLDPHPRVNPGDINWTLMDNMQMPTGGSIVKFE